MKTKHYVLSYFNTNSALNGNCLERAIIQVPQNLPHYAVFNFNINLFLCLRLLKISERLFNVVLGSDWMIASFSNWNRLQYFAPLRRGLDFAATSHYSHMTWWSRFDRLQFQIYLDSSVALAMFSFLNVCLRLLNLLLKSVSHDPKYFLVSIPGQFTGAQYMVALSRQLPFRGHSLLTRQLQDFTDLSSPLPFKNCLC